MNVTIGDIMTRWRVRLGAARWKGEESGEGRMIAVAIGPEGDARILWYVNEMVNDGMLA